MQAAGFLLRLVVATLVALALNAAVPGSSGTAWAQDPGEPTGELDDLEDLGDLDDLEGLDDLDGLDGDGAAGGGIRLRSFKGYAESIFRVYLRDRDEGKNDEQWLWRLEMEIDLDLTHGVTGYARPRFLVDALDSELVRAEPLEAYFLLGRDRWDLLAGQFVENWGIADTFNPVDVMNRRDIAVDALDPVRLGELGARARYFFDGGEVLGEPTLSVFVIPAFRRAEFPTDDGRWSLSQPPFELREDLDVTPRGEDRIFGALRGQGTLSTGLANADVQLVAAAGPEPFPLLVPGAPRPSGIVDLAPVYYGVVTAGGGVRAVPNADGWSELTLKLEMVYKAPYRTAERRIDAPDDYTQYVTGVDWLVPGVLTGSDQVTLTVEYLGEFGADDPAADFRPFQSDVVLRVFWEANDFGRTSVELRGLVDVKTAESVAEVIVERQLRFVHDDLKVRLGAQIFDPDRSEPGFFAFFPNNSNVSAGLRFDF